MKNSRNPLRKHNSAFLETTAVKTTALGYWHCFGSQHQPYWYHGAKAEQLVDTSIHWSVRMGEQPLAQELWRKFPSSSFHFTLSAPLPWLWSWQPTEPGACPGHSREVWCTPQDFKFLSTLGFVLGQDKTKPNNTKRTLKAIMNIGLQPWTYGLIDNDNDLKWRELPRWSPLQDLLSSYCEADTLFCCV